jgi:hypothetical protein
MHFKKLMTALFAVGVIANTSFAGLLYDTSIKDVRVYADGTVIVWTATLRSTSATASCAAGNEDGFMFNPATSGIGYNALLATTLAAKSTGSSVNILGTNTCAPSGTYTAIELVNWIQIK